MRAGWWAGAALLAAMAPLAVAQQPYPPAGADAQVQAGAAALGETGVDAGVDPPAVVGRLSQLLGNVSVEPASVEQFTPAELNGPLTTGDRLYADVGSLAEVEGGTLALRLGQQTDVTVTALTEALAQFGLASGSVHLRTYALAQGTTAEVDTPNVSVTVLQPGDVRVDVDPNSGTTVVTVLAGEVQVDGNGIQQVVEAGERLLLSGSNPVAAQFVRTVGQDGLDRFSSDRDQAYQAAVQAEAPYVNADTVGADSLEGYGDWSNDPTYGAVWYPTSVAAGWEPYRNGHWTWIAPWGWTWVESEPWGFAPFHYGRWAQIGPRWGWIPGPVFVRPVYSPALVVFVGGGGLGAGLTGWFPLGPHEIYQPWYHASPLYMNRVNVSNIYSRDQRQVLQVYNQRGRNLYTAGETQGFANRQATVAMQQANFAAGRPADQSRVRLGAGAALQAQVLPHPLVTPERSMVVQGAARAVPRQMARPVLASREDHALPMGSAGASMGPRGGATQPNAAPVERGGRPSQGGQPVYNAPAQAQPQPQGNRPAQPAASEPTQPAFGRQGSYRQPIQGSTPAIPAQAAQPQPQGNRPAQPAASEPTQPAFGRQGSYRQIIQGSTPAIPPQAAQPQSQPQVLMNRAVPPPTRPSFEQQRQAIQQSDPGRPLGPQQLNNLRQGQPAGPPAQREAPHPQAAPAAAPARQQPARNDDRKPR